MMTVQLHKFFLDVYQTTLLTTITLTHQSHERRPSIAAPIQFLDHLLGFASLAKIDERRIVGIGKRVGFVAHTHFHAREQTPPFLNRLLSISSGRGSR